MPISGRGNRAGFWARSEAGDVSPLSIRRADRAGFCRRIPAHPAICVLKSCYLPGNRGCGT